MRTHPALLLPLLLLIVSCGAAPPPSSTFSGIPPSAAEPLRPSGVTVVPAPEAGAWQPSSDPRSMGNPAAPITVVEFADFQCPYCASFARTTHPQIKAQYIDTGKVYFVHRDLPLAQIHPGTVLAAHAANCAAEQGAFWPMHTRLFQGFEAQEWGQGDARDLETFRGYGRELGLDEEALGSCITSNRYAQRIEADVRAALQLGFQGTPTFLINGQPLHGAQPFTTFQRAFEQILASAP
ncbi:MAG: DsbA family protein [Chloroflexota bacterium]